MTHDESSGILVTHCDSWRLKITHGDSSLLMVTQNNCWWLIVSHGDSLWPMVTHYDSWWLKITHRESSWILVTHHESWWLIMNHGLRDRIDYSLCIDYVIEIVYVKLYDSLWWRHMLPLVITFRFTAIWIIFRIT